MDTSIDKNTGWVRTVIFLCLLLVVCAGVSLLTTHLINKKDFRQHDQPNHGHNWLHQELQLTPEERAMIDAFEPSYRQEREVLLNQYQLQVSELARLLENTESHTPEITESIHELHQVHGKLQTLSIKHFYDMLSVLPPDKKDKLRGLAVEALSLPE